MARGIQIQLQNFTTLEDALNKFLKKCEIRNLRKDTIKIYREINTEFINFVGMKKSVYTIDSDAIDDYIMEVKKRGLKTSTVNTKIRHVRAFVYFCQKEYKLEKFTIPLLKYDEENKEPYSDEELIKLLTKPETTNFVEWRNWAHCNFFMATGCRLTTSLEIKVKDIDFRNKTIFFSFLKNRQQQYIPLSAELEKALKLYLSLWNSTPDDYLFPSFYDKTKLTRRTVEHSLNLYNHSRGVYTTGVHRFRHTFAKNYITSGGGAMQLQQILGHSTLEVTKKYVKLYATDLQRNFDKFCLLDNLVENL